MIDINSFLILVVCILSSVLLVVLIVLGIKLIGTVSKVDRILDELELKVRSFDKMFSVVDSITDSMAVVSDKIVDSIVYLIRKIFSGRKRKEEENYGQE